MEVVINNRINNSVEKYDFPDFDRNNLFLDEMKNFLAFFEGNEEPFASLTVPALASPSLFSKSKSALICDQHSFREFVFAQASHLQKKETCNSHTVPLYIEIATFPLRMHQAL